MRTGFANAMFGWVLSGTQAVVHLCFILRYLCKESSSSSAVLKEFVETGVQVTGLCQVIINTIGWATWFCWTQVLWSEIGSGDCLGGYNLFDFIIWLLLLLTTVWSALIVGIFLLVCLCCGPCMCKAYKDYMT